MKEFTGLTTQDLADLEETLATWPLLRVKWSDSWGWSRQRMPSAAGVLVIMDARGKRNSRGGWKISQLGWQWRPRKQGEVMLFRWKVTEDWKAETSWLKKCFRYTNKQLVSQTTLQERKELVRARMASQIRAQREINEVAPQEAQNVFEELTKLLEGEE